VSNKKQAQAPKLEQQGDLVIEHANPEELERIIKERAADTSKPLSLYPLTLDQAVRVIGSAPPMPKSDKKR
jgi:hypothetical protein